MSDTGPLRLGSDVLVFPLAAGVDLPTTALGDFVVVRSFVDGSLLDEAHLRQLIEGRIQSPVVDLARVMLVEFIFDRQSVWTWIIVQSDDHIQDIPLEGGEVIHHTGLIYQGGGLSTPIYCNPIAQYHLTTQLLAFSICSMHSMLSVLSKHPKTAAQGLQVAGKLYRQFFHHFYDFLAFHAFHAFQAEGDDDWVVVSGLFD